LKVLSGSLTGTNPILLHLRDFIEFVRLDKAKKPQQRIITVSKQVGRPPFQALKEMKYCRLVFLTKGTSHQHFGAAEKYQTESHQFRLSQ
jgi:hypothetical protein